MVLFFPVPFITLMAFFSRQTDRRCYRLSLACAHQRVFIHRVGYEPIEPSIISNYIATEVQDIHPHFKYMIDDRALQYVQDNNLYTMAVDPMNHTLLLNSIVFPCTEHIKPSIYHPFTLDSAYYFDIDSRLLLDICTEAYALPQIDILFYDNPHQFTFTGVHPGIYWIISGGPPSSPPTYTFSITTTDLKRMELYIDTGNIRLSVISPGVLIFTQHRCHVVLAGLL